MQQSCHLPSLPVAQRPVVTGYASKMMFSFRAGSASASPQSEHLSRAGAGAGDQEPRPKRAKISIACNVCKARKTKCDGVRPGKLKFQVLWFVWSNVCAGTVVCGPCAKRRQGSQICRYREEEAPSGAK